MCKFDLETCSYADVEHIDQIIFQLEEIKYELVDEDEDEDD